MQALFFIRMENYSKVRNIVMTDDLISRHSINFRDCNALDIDKEGYYLEIVGDEKAIKKARELLKDLATEVSGKEEDEILQKIAEQEESAMEGFGSIFG